MAPLRPGLTSVRRAVGVGVVAFLLSGAVVFYRLAPDDSTTSAIPSTTANFSASPTPTRLGAESATPGRTPSSADPSRASTTVPPTSTTTRGTGDSSGSGSAEEAISVERPAGPARPFQTVGIQGTYRGGAHTFLRVERWERHRWMAFPLSTKTDQSGQFTAYVELGQPGLYWLRVRDPDSAVKSKPFVLVIRG
jgi:hypothetical protein